MNYVAMFGVVLFTICVVDMGYDSWILSRKRDVRYRNQIVHILVFKIGLTGVLSWAIFERLVMTKMFDPAVTVLLYAGLAMFLCALSRFIGQLTNDARLRDSGRSHRISRGRGTDQLPMVRSHEAA